MPQLRVVQRFPFGRARLFAFFARPGNVIAVAPPALGLRLVEGPEAVHVGARVAVQARRWGLSSRVVTEVVELREPEWIVEEQRQGPFASWRHSRRFSEDGPGVTELEEVIDFEPPGGLLGLTLTAARIEEDLRTAFAFRQERVVGRLSAAE